MRLWLEILNYSVNDACVFIDIFKWLFLSADKLIRLLLLLEIRRRRNGELLCWTKL